MRVVLPKLERLPASQLAEALRNNLSELGLSEEKEQDRLFATLQFVERGLPTDLQPLLPLVGLHEGYLDAYHLEAMSRQVDASWTRARIDELMRALSNAGLCKD